VARIPNIYEQVFRTGDAMTGVSYTGVGGGDSAGGAAQTADGHIYRVTPLTAEGAIDGGLLALQGEDEDGNLVEACLGYRKLVSIYVFFASIFWMTTMK